MPVAMVAARNRMPKVIIFRSMNYMLMMSTFRQNFLPGNRQRAGVKNRVAATMLTRKTTPNTVMSLSWMAG